MAKQKTTQEPCLWERQPKESEQAWEAFLTYRDMEPPRKVQAVADKLSKSRQQITKFKANWFWDERVRAYDNEIQKEALAKAVKERQKMNERHTNIAMRLQKAALEALENLDASELSFKDIREAVKLGAELERRARTESIGEYRVDIATEEQDEDDVVIVVPDNGRKVGGDE